MRQLLGDNVLEDGILRQLFLQRLPQNIQLILASTPQTVSLEDLSLLADKILEGASPHLSVTALTPSIPPPTMHDHNQQIAALQGQINQLTAQLQALSLNLIHVIHLVFVDVVALILAFLGLRFPVHLAALVCLHTVGIMSVLALPPTNASHLVLFSLTHILQSLTLPLYNSRKTSPPATSGDQSSWLFHHQSPILHHRPSYWYLFPR